jgi:hypothetical protein
MFEGLTCLIIALIIVDINVVEISASYLPLNVSQIYLVLIA